MISVFIISHNLGGISSDFNHHINNFVDWKDTSYNFDLVTTVLKFSLKRARGPIY